MSNISTIYPIEGITVLCHNRNELESVLQIGDAYGYHWWDVANGLASCGIWEAETYLPNVYISFWGNTVTCNTGYYDSEGAKEAESFIRAHFDSPPKFIEDNDIADYERTHRPVADPDCPLFQKNPLSKEKYQEYLNSTLWKFTKAQAIKKVRGHCPICGCAHKPFVVHHLTYERITKEDKSDVVALCENCHTSVHLIKERIKWEWMNNDTDYRSKFEATLDAEPLMSMIVPYLRDNKLTINCGADDEYRFNRTLSASLIILETVIGVSDKRGSNRNSKSESAFLTAQGKIMEYLNETADKPKSENGWTYII